MPKSVEEHLERTPEPVHQTQYHRNEKNTVLQDENIELMESMQNKYSIRCHAGSAMAVYHFLALCSYKFKLMRVGWTFNYRFFMQAIKL